MFEGTVTRTQKYHYRIDKFMANCPIRLSLRNKVINKKNLNNTIDLRLKTGQNKKVYNLKNITNKSSDVIKLESVHMNKRFV